MDPWFEDSMSSKHMDKWQIGDKDERSAHVKISLSPLDQDIFAVVTFFSLSWG